MGLWGMMLLKCALALYTLPVPAFINLTVNWTLYWQMLDS